MASFSSARLAPHRHRRGEDGYILLTLILVVALMGIFALAVIIPIKFEVQRDQEQEMIHRGVQYSRAIRAYYKKFGRYPTRLEDLDNTNNVRFLRKRYKDPLNKNQDFKLLHYGEPGLSLGGGIGGGAIPGATPAGSAGLGGSGTNGSAFGGSAFGGSASGGSAFGGSAFGSSGSSSSGVNSSGVFSQSSGLGGNSNSAFGANSNPQTPSGQPGTNPAAGSDSSEASSGTGQAEGSSGGQVVGGGPIVGVASVSKKATIREFNKKKKYNEWQFVYDPTTDHGGLITTPNQPSLQGFGSQPGLNGAQPAGGNGSAFGNSNGSAFGNSNGSSNGSSFGQSSSFGNSATPGGSPPPVPPSSSSPQQQ